MAYGLMGTCRICGKKSPVVEMTEMMCNKCHMRMINEPEPGSVYDLINAAAKKERAPSEFTFSLQGDLMQMGTQKSFLLGRGFEVKQSDVYPMIKAEDEVRALNAIWATKITGWWHYKEKYIKYNICSSAEYDNVSDVYMGKVEKKKKISKKSVAQNKEETVKKEVATPLIKRKISW